MNDCLLVTLLFLITGIFGFSCSACDSDIWKFSTISRKILKISRCCDIRHLSFRLCSRISLFLKTAIPAILCPWAKIQNGLSKNSWRNWARQSPLSLIFEGISLWFYLPSLNFMPLIFSFVEDAVITQNLSYGDLTCKEHYGIMLWQGKLD